MNLKNLIDKRKDILFAEIGALIHDLGKLSKEFGLQATEDNFDFFYDHSLIFGRDYQNASQEQFYNINNNELEQLIEDVNNKVNNGTFTTFKEVREYIKNQVPEITSNNQANRFIVLLQSKYSRLDNLSTLKHITENLSIIGSPVTVADLISKHHRKETFNNLNGNSKRIIELLINADGIDSAVDKMVADVSLSKQLKDYTYISTAFGCEKEKIDLNLADTDKNSLTKIREIYANKLADILNDLKNKNCSNTNLESWISQRKELLQETRNAFLKALGETRRPANDVTLWDHSYSVASLYKSALAEVVINGWKEPKDIKWRLLSIRFDGDEFYHSVNKIAATLGRKSLVEKIFENIKILLEVIIPIGNEIYRDENGSVFLVPESVDNNEIPESADEGIYVISDDVWDKVKDIKIEAELNFEGEWEKKKLQEVIHNKPANIKQLIEALSSYISQGIFIPAIHISGPSRGALNIGEEIGEKNNRKRKHKIDIESLKELWKDKEKGYFKCSVCGLRPVPLTNEEKENLQEKIKKSGWRSLSEDEKNYYKAFEKKVCIDCLKIATNRVEEWKNNQKWNENEPEKPSFDTSIWLDEIADENNRVALVYISFDLEKWLSGEMLNTFFSQPLEILREAGISEDSYDAIVSRIKEKFNDNDIEFWKILNPYLKDKTGNEIFDEIVKKRDENWKKTLHVENENDTKLKSKILLLHLTRKHPSFARLRRIWETTKNWGIDVFKEAKKKLNMRKRPMISFEAQGNLKITHTYMFKNYSGTKFELVILSETNAAIIANGDKFDISESKTIELYDEDLNSIVATLQNVQLSSFNNKFYPLIPYQFEPTKTLFFMPLKYVWEVIEIIKEQYEIQFSKVQNRLPIKIGFVAFNKKMPMYVVLEAAKKMYSKKSEVKEVDICNIIKRNKSCNIIMSDGNEYHFSYSTGDPNKKDLFHPYFIVKNNNGWKTYFDEKWQTIKHVTELQKGDRLLFYPSQFDFLWLDSNIRRFDVGGKRRHWLFKKKSPKPYNLKDIKKFERLKNLLFEQLSLTTSQIMNLYGLLISKIQEWRLDEITYFPIDDSAFKEFVKNSILSIPLRLKISDATKKGEITKEDFEFFEKSILNGVFFDLIDMWHTVLKRKFKEENNE